MDDQDNNGADPARAALEALDQVTEPAQFRARLIDMRAALEREFAMRSQAARDLEAQVNVARQDLLRLSGQVMLLDQLIGDRTR